MTHNAAFSFPLKNAYEIQRMVIKCEQEWLFPGTESSTGKASGETEWGQWQAEGRGGLWWQEQEVVSLRCKRR